MPDIAIIVATLLGPILAVQAQKWIERFQGVKNRRDHIFRTLMATRAARVSAEHVQALNMIDFEFASVRNVLAAWNDYRDQLNTGHTPETFPVWITRGDELFHELLYQMAVTVGYKFDKSHIRKSAYSPVAHGNLEQDQLVIRKGLVDLFSNKLAIPVVLVPANKDVADQQADTQQMLQKLLSGEVPYKVQIVNPEALEQDAVAREPK